MSIEDTTSRERVPADTAEPATTALLLDVLDRAAAAHHLYEVEIGGPHADWSPWYAAHMARTLTQSGYRISRSDAQPPS